MFRVNEDELKETFLLPSVTGFISDFASLLC